MIAARTQIETADACVLDSVAVVGVAEGQRVVRIELIIETRSDDVAALASQVHVREPASDQCLRVQGYRVDDRPVVDPFALYVQVERRALVDRATEGAAQFVQVERRLLSGIGIA